MNRREFLSYAGGAAISAALSRVDWTAAQARTPAGWRTFEVITRVEILKPSGLTRIWLPAAMPGKTRFQRTLANHFRTDGGTVKLAESGVDSLGMVVAEFPAGTKPEMMLTSRVATKDYAVNLSKPNKTGTVKRAELNYFLRPTRLIPTDEIVRSTANQITAGNRTDTEKARAIYEWIVENTFRNPKTRGCGSGDIRFMLETQDLGGKCADLNALYVGLARASGIPARDVYGIRVAKSELGYKSLGASTENVTKAQHCRAEVYLEDYGWVPVDPADVRKVMLEEPPGNRSLDDPMVKSARSRLFGSWEMNWMAYNFSHDVMLPGSKDGPLGFLMYPQAETADGRLDCLDPDNFKYEIEAREISTVTG